MRETARNLGARGIEQAALWLEAVSCNFENGQAQEILANFVFEIKRFGDFISRPCWEKYLE